MKTKLIAEKDKALLLVCTETKEEEAGLSILMEQMATKAKRWKEEMARTRERLKIFGLEDDPLHVERFVVRKGSIAEEALEKIGIPCAGCEERIPCSHVEGCGKETRNTEAPEGS